MAAQEIEVAIMTLDSLVHSLQMHVRAMAYAPRVPETDSHTDARNYISDKLQAAGWSVSEMDCSASQPCINLVTEPLPAMAEGPLVIVGAHYDTVAGSPGADDNGSAVAALIEMASGLAPQLQSSSPTRGRLQLVAYDQEENGLLGSRAHAEQLAASGTTIDGMIALEMIGYAEDQPGSQQLPEPLAGMYPDVGNFIAIVGNEASASLLSKMSAGMKSVADLPVEELCVPEGMPLMTEAQRSDHASFWACDFPAVMVTDTSNFRNPHYHQPSDTPETLDYTFLAKVTLGLQEAVWQLLQ